DPSEVIRRASGGSWTRLSYEGVRNPLVDSVAHGQHQVPDQAEPSERAPPREEQGGALGAQGGGEEGPLRERGGHDRAGVRRLPGARQGGLRRRPPQADGGPAQVPAGALRERAGFLA